MNKYLLVLPVFLFACGGDVKDQLGLRRDAPDEFAVERRPALDLPPAFKLRVPGEGEAEKIDVRDEAQEILFGEPVQASKSTGFLGKLGVDEAQPDIRATLKDEYGVEDPDFFERVRAISDDTINQTLVDAPKEKERIEENKKAGKSAAEGEVATKPAKGVGSVIDAILGD